MSERRHKPNFVPNARNLCEPDVCNASAAAYQEQRDQPEALAIECGSFFEMVDGAGSYSPKVAQAMQGRHIPQPHPCCTATSYAL